MSEKKRIRDGEKTKKNVLSAALEIFSKYGYNGASLVQVSKQSGASVGLILHHFKTKKKLYAAVVKNNAMTLMGELQPVMAALQKSETKEGLRLLVKTTLHFFKDNTHMMRLSFWNFLEGDTVQPGDMTIFHAINQAILQGQEQGVLRKDIPPFVIMAMVRGATDYWLLSGERMMSALELGKTTDFQDEFVDKLFLTFYENK